MQSVLILKVESKHAKAMYDALINDLFKKGRADVKVKQKNNVLEFKISSSDFTSIRATINSVLLKLRMFSELDNLLSKNKLKK